MKRFFVALLTLTLLISVMPSGFSAKNDFDAVYAANSDKSDNNDEEIEIEEEDEYSEDYEIRSDKYLLYDTETDSVLISQKSDSKINPAGFTKILTAITVIENVKDLNKTVTVPDGILEDYDYSNGNIGLASGEKISYKDLIYAMMMRDAGDCAIALAHTAASSYDDFIKKMNDTAKKLGAKNSVFTEPAGIESKNQHTTLDDMLLIVKYACANKTFAEAASASDYQIAPTNKNETGRRLYNENYYLSKFYSLDYYNENVVQAKGAYPDVETSAMFVHYDNGTSDLICLCADSENNDRYNYAYKDINHLIDRGKNYYMDVTLTQKDEIITEVPIHNGANADRVLLVCADSVKTKLAKDYDKTKTERKVTLNQKIAAPIKKYETLGRLDIINEGKIVGSTNLVAFSSVESSVMKLIMHHFNRIISSMWFIVSLILIIGFAVGYTLVINYKKKKRKPNTDIPGITPFRRK